MTIVPRSRLIIALDVTNKDEALSIASKLGGVVDAIKVNYPLVLACGLDIIGDLKQYSNVIADFKVADIPNTNSLICEETFKAGADAIICQGFVGSDSVKACVEVAKKYHKETFVVTEMSHPGALDFLQPKAFDLVDIAVKSGASGIIAPATRPGTADGDQAACEQFEDTIARRGRTGRRRAQRRSMPARTSSSWAEVYIMRKTHTMQR